MTDKVEIVHEIMDGGPKGLRFAHFFTKPGVHPFESVEWDIRDAAIINEKGDTVFEQKGVEVPKSWSQTAVNIVASKYFRGKQGTPAREWSLRQMIDRVSRTVASWGQSGGYFATAEDAATFESELTYLLINQYLSFNSPVWFNVGVEKEPQCSACFILSVKDEMRSILNLVNEEGMIFKYGSGSGVNVSALRSAKETLSSGGKASGPVSFMRGFDAFAGVIKSGGKTRRAAKMVIMNIDHPDVMEFIKCKAEEEKKAWALIDAGYDGTFNVAGGAYDSVQFQNANHSVRVTDDFMRAVDTDGTWTTHYVVSKQPADNYKAKEVMAAITDSAHICGDPALQFDSTTNRWHTCPNSGRINASNPCAEFVFLDNSACNLASLNLMKFRTPTCEFDIAAFERAIDIILTAMEIIVDNAGYPTELITRNSKEFRPLGLGYANLGALLMSRGLAYDSEAGRNFSAALTALMTAAAYKQSAVIAKEVGTFKHYKDNEQPMLNVMNMHRDYSYKIGSVGVPVDLLASVTSAWDSVVDAGKKWGFRNANVTLLAPTGTISFMMDCDTTGIEPDIALVKYKRLVGGGVIKMVNRTVPEALKNLGYSDGQIRDILEHIDKNDTIEGAPGLLSEHLPVFDCAFKPAKGTRTIHYMGHVRMMAAAQPFISGAISKTVNMPNEATQSEIADVYMTSWKMGLKAIAIYRDGCKRSQPLMTSKIDEKKVQKTVRHKMPPERASITHKFAVGGHEGYITVGLYEDGAPGEIFIKMAKEGSTISGLMDSIGLSVSMALQYGVPLKVLADKFVHMRFEPSGVTENPDIRFAKSIVDYIFRWLATKFLKSEELESMGLIAPINGTTLELPKIVKPEDTEAKQKRLTEKFDLHRSFTSQSDAPPCYLCGSIMVRSGSCYKCLNCGATSGCS